MRVWFRAHIQVCQAFIGRASTCTPSTVGMQGCTLTRGVLQGLLIATKAVRPRDNLTTRLAPTEGQDVYRDHLKPGYQTVVPNF